MGNFRFIYIPESKKKMLHLPFLTFALGGGSLSATIVGVVSLLLFGLVGVIAGPNLSKFDSDA